jgi:hypothetical protein
MAYMALPMNLMTHDTGHDTQIGGYHLVDYGSNHKKSVQDSNIDHSMHDRVDEALNGVHP